MKTTPDRVVDPTLPALVVRCGSTAQTWLPLERDVLLLGRSARCDFRLNSPEVAPVHCLLIRRADGWQVRDCGSLNGSRLNGKPIQEAPLGDGDVLQFGTFSFDVCLPAPRHDPVPPVGTRLVPGLDVAKVVRARRRLAQQVLGRATCTL